MEEAIGKFMEGMEKQERTGYSTLHKLLQGLPVPVHNTAGSMTQAEALEGGFSALMVRYILVHTCLSLYELTCTDLYCQKVSLSGGDCSPPREKC